jgi:hypothetical protein
MTFEKQKTGLSDPKLAEALATPYRGLVSRVDMPLIYKIGLDQLAAQVGQRTLTNFLRLQLSKLVREHWQADQAALEAALDEFKSQTGK